MTCPATMFTHSSDNHGLTRQTSVPYLLLSEDWIGLTTRPFLHVMEFPSPPQQMCLVFNRIIISRKKHETNILCILWNLTEILDKAERQEPQLILLAPLDACSALNVHICGIRMNRKAFCLLPKEVFPVQWTTKQLFSLLIWVEADFIVKKKKKKAKIGCMYKRSSQPALISAPQIPPI